MYFVLPPHFPLHLRPTFYLLHTISFSTCLLVSLCVLCPIFPFETSSWRAFCSPFSLSVHTTWVVNFLFSLFLVPFYYLLFPLIPFSIFTSVLVLRNFTSHAWILLIPVLHYQSIHWINQDWDLCNYFTLPFCFSFFIPLFQVFISTS